MGRGNGLGVGKPVVLGAPFVVIIDVLCIRIHDDVLPLLTDFCGHLHGVVLAFNPVQPVAASQGMGWSHGEWRPGRPYVGGMGLAGCRGLGRTMHSYGSATGRFSAGQQSSFVSVTGTPHKAA